MKTIVKLIVAVVVLNAAARAGWAVWNYYQLRDAAQQAIVFGAQEQPAEIQNVILRKAIELDLPVDATGITVLRQGAKTEATASYTQPVEVFPRYVYPFSFSFSVDTVSLSGLK